ncbi:MAG: hypothetical protein ACYC3L_12550, partial [Gemmatimonadaceae bacterium]
MKRRNFITAAGLGSAAFALPASAQPVASSAAPATAPRAGDGRDVPRYPQDAWFDHLPGTHRLFIDATNPEEAGDAVGFAWNYMRTSTSGYQEKDEDQAIVICLRHSATEFAFANGIWSKYDVLRKQKYKHPDTGKQVKGGNVFRPGSTGPKSMDDAFTLDGLARRGVHFAICGAATRGLAGMIAGKDATRDERQQVVDELMANGPANAHFMASGILAAQRAGEYGYSIIK